MNNITFTHIGICLLALLFVFAPGQVYALPPDGAQCGGYGYTYKLSLTTTKDGLQVTAQSSVAGLNPCGFYTEVLLTSPTGRLKSGISDANNLHTFLQVPVSAMAILALGTDTGNYTANSTMTVEDDGVIPFVYYVHSPLSQSLNVAATNIKLEHLGTVISTDGKYSENTTIRATAVRADSGATITTFAATLNIAEDATFAYSSNGGVLPSTVDISSGGTATFVAKSLIGPKSEGAAGAPPDPAFIKTTNYPVYQASNLRINQWIVSNARIDTHSSGQVYDWVQSMTRDVFAYATGDTATVLGAVSTYTIQAGPWGGLANWVRAAQSPIVINPYFLDDRLNNAQSVPVCGNASSKGLTNTLIHEARHAYQASRAASSGNDQDGDFLVKVMPISPTDIVVDTTVLRSVCDEVNKVISQRSYRGDTVFDQPGTPDFASYAWEMDAWKFASLHDH